MPPDSTCTPIILPRIIGVADAADVVIPCLPSISIDIGGSWNVWLPAPEFAIVTRSDKSFLVDNLIQMEKSYIP